MKKSILFCAVAVVALGTLPLATFAHHAFAAEFDRNQPIEIKGKISKVEWMNPHARIYVDVIEADGTVVNWNLEMGSPNGLMRRGWTRNTLEIGTEVMIKGTQARDGSFKGNVQAVVIAETCQKLFAGTSQRDFVEDEAAPAENCEL